jgi:UDP-3-O-[3-hydroxymyristoyl] glucosamine N-acyltransferase
MKISEIADFLGAELVGDGNIEITGVSKLDSAVEGQISFVDRPDADVLSGASCLIVPAAFEHGPGIPLLKTADPKLAFARIAGVLHPPRFSAKGIYSNAVVSPSARVANDVSVGPFVCIGDESVIGGGTQIRSGANIGDRVTIGTNCVIHANVSIEDGCTIGNNVVLHAGVVIGADGFGYVRGADAYVKFPQIGTVVIEDDVEIGANSCVDRGALGETRIGKGTKIDNLVQIAHNVRIGERVVIAAQTGISGSTTIEDDCVIGGQVGMGDHAVVKSGAIIGSQAGVLPGKIVRPGVWWGTPVQPLDDYKRQNAHLKGLDRLKESIKALKAEVDRLSKSSR